MHVLVFAYVALAGTLIYLLAGIVDMFVRPRRNRNRVRPAKEDRRLLDRALRRGQFQMDSPAMQTLLHERATYFKRFGTIDMVLAVMIFAGGGMALCWFYFWPSLVPYAIVLQALAALMLVAGQRALRIINKNARAMLAESLERTER